MQNSSAAFGRSVDSTHWTGERLDSWKEVASFFRREVRTVQLWEKSEGLPVRRQHHKKLGSVYAYRQELEAWWIARSSIQNGSGRTADLPGPAARGKRMAAAESADGADCPTILVLPFEAFHSSLDRGTLRQMVERFADGLRSDVVLELVRLKFHPVILPIKNYSFQPTSAVDLKKQLAQEVEADLVLTGSIRYSGDQVRVTVQMIRAAGSLCIWSDRFDARLDDLLHAQAELARCIGQALPAHRTNSPHRCSQPAANNCGLAAHACTMGFHYWQRRGRTALIKAIHYFQDAIELDPQCADAYAGLADTYVSLSYNHMMPALTAASKAREAVDTALRIDKSSTRVRNALINLLIHCNWDMPAAERQCSELVDRGAMDARTIQLYSTLMNLRGQHQDAINLALHAYRLEPQSDMTNGQVSVAYFYAGDYGSALSFIRRTIDLQPEYLMGYALLGRTEAELGNWDEAIRAFNRGLEISPRSMFIKALLAYAHAGSGDRAKANWLLRELEDGRNDECFPAYDVSAVHAILGREDDALRSIHRAVGTRDMKSIFVEHEPRFASLRGSMGFKQIASAIRSDSIMPLAV
jgi:TolB-like protein/tetratricopeptide (TPR) repeat protein